MDTAAAPAFAPDYDIAPGEDGVALVEALRAALPGPTPARPVYYEITSAIVYTTDGWVTLEVRKRNARAPSWEPAGVPHDITIDLEDRMVGGKATKGIRAAIEAALATLAPAEHEAAQ